MELSDNAREVILQRVNGLLSKMRNIMELFQWTEIYLEVCWSLASFDKTQSNELCCIQKLASDYRVCSEDSGHHVLAKNYDRHVRRCRMKKMGYSDEDIQEIRQSSKFYYEEASNITRIVLGLCSLVVINFYGKVAIVFVEQDYTSKFSAASKKEIGAISH